MQPLRRTVRQQRHRFPSFSGVTWCWEMQRQEAPGEHDVTTHSPSITFLSKLFSLAQETFFFLCIPWRATASAYGSSYRRKGSLNSTESLGEQWRIPTLGAKTIVCMHGVSVLIRHIFHVEINGKEMWQSLLVAISLG